MGADIARVSSCTRGFPSPCAVSHLMYESHTGCARQSLPHAAIARSYALFCNCVCGWGQKNKEGVSEKLYDWLYPKRGAKSNVSVLVFSFSAFHAFGVGCLYVTSGHITVRQNAGELVE